MKVPETPWSSQNNFHILLSLPKGRDESCMKVPGDSLELPDQLSWFTVPPQGGFEIKSVSPDLRSGISFKITARYTFVT
jgi:hypothetical protein